MFLNLETSHLTASCQKWQEKEGDRFFPNKHYLKKSGNQIKKGHQRLRWLPFLWFSPFNFLRCYREAVAVGLWCFESLPVSRCSDRPGTGWESRTNFYLGATVENVHDTCTGTSFVCDSFIVIFAIQKGFTRTRGGTAVHVCYSKKKASHGLTVRKSDVTLYRHRPHPPYFIVRGMRASCREEVLYRYPCSHSHVDNHKLFWRK